MGFGLAAGVVEFENDRRLKLTLYRVHEWESRLYIHLLTLM
jgi:hypothetical protein